MDDTNVDNNTQFLTGSIDDYITGLADGIQKAQRQLSQMAITLHPGGGGHQIRAEFELKMSLEVAGLTDREAAVRRSCAFARPIRRGSGRRTPT